jgi:hypothetical protein
MSRDVQRIQKDANLHRLHHIAIRKYISPKPWNPSSLRAGFTIKNQPQCRSNSTTSVLPLKVPSSVQGEHTTIEKKNLDRPENRTPNLDRAVGSEWTAKAKGIQADLHHLGIELQNIFKQLQSLGTILESTGHVSRRNHLAQSRRFI